MRTTAIKIIACFCLALVRLASPAPVMAQPGTLDPSFGSNGFVRTDVNGSSNDAKSMAIQPDGKIVLGGGGVDLTLARYLANGMLDGSFGVGGIVTHSPTPYEEAVEALAIQPDGKILVTAHNRSTADSVFRFILVRFNTDGSVDNTFGANGLATASLGTGSHNVRAIVLQADGKILVGGEARETGGSGKFALARFDANGTLDPSFNGTGKVITEFENTVGSFIAAIRIQPDGRIVALGTARPPDTLNDFAAARYHPSGALDTTFGTGGKVTTHFIAHDLGWDGIIQPDGKIVMTGEIGSFALLRYDANGVLDGSFGQGGKVITTIGTSGSRSAAVALQPDGKILVTGVSGPFGGYLATTARYLPSGSLDMSFGVGGIVTSAFSPNTAADPRGIELDSSGRILIAGALGDSATAVQDFFVARYLNDAFVSRRSPFDFDGDGKTDIGIFRPPVGEWWISRSSNGSVLAAQFGAMTDTITPADHTGDSKSDISVWRPSTGEWFVLRSEDFSFYAFPFGTSGDIPVPADYDADDKADAAVFRPSTATWYIRRSTDGGTTIQQFGASTDIPVVSDYDGDGQADIGIFRPGPGEWWINRSTGGLLALQFGNSSDKPVQGDYTGDGKSDVALWRPSTGEWFVLRSEDFSFYAFPFGTTGDVPAPGDYDGDGEHDATVFRPSSATWYSSLSTSGTLIQQFGATGDRPIPNAFVP